MWNGALAFGAVAVPVKLFLATETRSLAMRELHSSDGAPIAHRRFNPATGRDVEAESLARGAQTGDGEWVVLSNDEIRAAEKPKRRAVEIEVFVPDREIDPVYLDRAYNVAPQQSGAEAYGVLLEALRRTGTAGIGRVVLRSRERLVALRALSDGPIRMHTMRFHDELVPGSRVRLDDAPRPPSREELRMASALIDSLTRDFRLGEMKDAYRQRVIALARAKAHGRKPKRRARGRPKPTDEHLLAALRASVAKGS